MTTILVVYGTRSGCTTTIAHRVGETLRGLQEGSPGPADGGPLDVDVYDADTAPSPGRYDAVVIGSGVRLAQWHPSAVEWVRLHAEVLRETPVAFFSVGLMVAKDPAQTETVRGYTDPLIGETGVVPVDVGVFGGWYDPTKLTLSDRIRARMRHLPQGDHRDLAAVDRWALAVAPLLK